MKHMLALSIATFAVFAFLGVIIATGELSFTEEAPPTHYISIESIVTHCPDSLSTNIPTLPIDNRFASWLSKTCHHKPHCEVKTREFFTASGDLTPNCTDEIIIRYHCLPVDIPADEADVALEKPAFLYENQHGALSCANKQDIAS